MTAARAVRVPSRTESASPGRSGMGTAGELSELVHRRLGPGEGVCGVRAEEGKRLGCSRRDIELARRLSVVDVERGDHWIAA